MNVCECMCGVNMCGVNVCVNMYVCECVGGYMSFLWLGINKEEEVDTSSRYFLHKFFFSGSKSLVPWQKKKFSYITAFICHD